MKKGKRKKIMEEVMSRREGTYQVDYHGSAVLTALPVNSRIFWIVTLFSSERARRFGRTYRLLL
jgi:hypothetical protein